MQKDFFTLLYKQESKKSNTERGCMPRLQELAERSRNCRSCGLRDGCSQVVFADGDPSSLLMLVGEAPGASEDRLGLPFVGSAGQLLNKILEAIELRRKDVYITNVIKCRPPGNRPPTPDEVKTCYSFLAEQIEIINPCILVCLGALATKTLIDKDALITKVRGNWIEKDGRFYMPTFHPAALLRDSKKKKPVWEDFQKIEAKIKDIKLKK